MCQKRTWSIRLCTIIIMIFIILMSLDKMFVYESRSILHSRTIIAKRLNDDTIGDYQRVQYITYRTDMCKPRRLYKMDPLKKKAPSFIQRYKNPCWHEKRDLRCIPYVYLVGVAKCGTTDLFERLTLHAVFVAPTDKEPRWLTYGQFWENSSLEYYASKYFSPLSQKMSNSSKTHLITGEGSVTTLEGAHYWDQIGGNVGHDEPLENVAEYIYHTNKNAKILINVRNPVDRMWSEYLAFSHREVKSATIFHELVYRSIRLYNDCLLSRTLRACMYDMVLSQFATRSIEEQILFRDKCNFSKPIDIALLRRGVYHIFIQDYLKVFPKEQILIQRLEDMTNDLKGTLLRTYKFLDLEHPSETNLKKILKLSKRNSRKSNDIVKGDMLNETRQMLYKFYKPHNEALAQLLNDSAFNYGPIGGCRIQKDNKWVEYSLL